MFCRYVDDNDEVFESLGIMPARRSTRNQRELAMEDETGQKERMPPYNETTSPLLTSQSDDGDREEDSGLSHQIECLTAKNQLLQSQLKEREQERDRLREQLEVQRNDRGLHSIYSPPNLPSRVLDGRKVLRDSVPLVTSPGLPSPFARLSPLPGGVSPLRVTSPLPTTSSSSRATPTSSHPHSPIGGMGGGGVARPARLPTTPNSPLRRNVTMDEFILPTTSTRGDGVPSQPVQASSSSSSYLQEIEVLKRDNSELERRLHEISEEKRRLEIELKVQKEAFFKMQAREQDLSKDIEILRDENSHHTGAIQRLQGEREGLRNENESLHEALATINDKLNKTEKCYKEVEHENLSLEAEIEQLVHDKKQLYEDKQKLQQTVEDTLKTKENYRSAIKQLREQNQSLESRVQRSEQHQQHQQQKTVKTEKKKVSVPVTKEQKALSEVLNLREEKVQLQGRLLSAQQEIDSLEAHLKVQEKKDAIPTTTTTSVTAPITEESLCLEVASCLAIFHSEVEVVRNELDATRDVISYFSRQQQLLARESVFALVSKCREHLSVAEQDKAKMASALEITESSLRKITEDYQVLKGENAKLLEQRKVVSDEVSALKEEISRLQDQRKMQAVQLSQSEAMVQEKDAKLSEVEKKERELRDTLATSEKNWKREYDRLELEWSGKVAEAVQNCSFLEEEKENLLTKKQSMEKRLAEVLEENESLVTASEEMEAKVKALEERIVTVTLDVDRNEKIICRAQTGIASLLVQRTLLKAQLRVEREDMRAGMEKERTSIKAENLSLQASILSLKRANVSMTKKLADIAGKDEQIKMLETKITTLTDNQMQLQSEMDSIGEKHSSVLREFQLLEEAHNSRRLDNEKLKITLTTEIQLLKSKLASVEREKEVVEKRLSEMAAKTGGGVGGESGSGKSGSSAFHVVSSSLPSGSASGKQMEQQQGKKHAVNSSSMLLPCESKQQRKSSETTSSRSMLDMQKRVSQLEAENKHLKETSARKSMSASSSVSATTAASSSGHTSSHTSPSALDEEMVTNLRKRVTEMTRKMFFLESDKQNLTDKVKGLTSSLKSAREAKDHVSTEHIQKLQEENRSLRKKLQKLEGTLTKKLMAADSKIIETVKENEKLRQKLLKIQSALSSEQSRATGLDSLLTVLKSESDILCGLKATLSASSSELEQLESGHQRIENLQQEIQLSLSTQDLPEMTTTSPVSKNMPAVFKSLPAGYISNLQGSGSRSGSGSGSESSSSSDRVGRLDSRSASLSSIAACNPELHKKMSEINSATLAFSQQFKQHKSTIKQKDVEISSVHERLVVLEEKFKMESERSKSLHNIFTLIQGLDLKGEEVQTVMQQQIEKLQDQVGTA